MSVSAKSDLRWEFEDIYVKNIHRFLVSENLQVYFSQAALTNYSNFTSRRWEHL